MEFYKILNKLIEENNITAYKMSKDTGIPQAVIGRWRRGERNPSKDNLKKIADYFHVSSDFLLSINSDELKETKDEYINKKYIYTDKNGEIIKKEISEEDWEKYNAILKAAMPHLFDN